MKTIYRVSFYSVPALAIKRVTVISEQDGEITIESADGVRHTEMIGSEFHCYRESFDEARQTLIDRANNDVIQHDHFAKRARAAVAVYTAMQESV